VLLLIAFTAAAAGEPLTYEKHVRPILKQHCFHCHGEEPNPKGGLDLRTVKMMKKGGESGAAIKPGDLASHLWERVSSDEMPEGTKKVSAAQKEILKRWIREGAKTARPEPDDPNQARFTPEELSHWAFQPMKDQAPPMNSGRTEVDRFLLAKLSAAGIRGFSPAADRRTFIRRATFDLLGLPPTPQEVEAFVNDPSVDAVETLIDRLLASPQYGERWGRHWLDVAGYAETYGNLGKDHDRPHAWRYRDYVVASFNADKPFDEFLKEQIAGDELAKRPYDFNDPKTVERLTATGFLRMAPDVTATNGELMDRNQAVADAFKVATGAFLGMTVGCAQCHDHKYDPVSIDDYYRLRAFFDPAFDLHQWKPPEQRVIDATLAAQRTIADGIEAEAKKRDEALSKKRDENAKQVLERELAKLPATDREPARKANDTPPGKRTPAQTAILKKYTNIVSVAHIRGQLVEYDPPSHQKFKKEEDEIARLRGTKPPPRLLLAVQETPGRVPKSAVFLRGDPKQPSKEVRPGELTALGGTWQPPASPKDAPSTGRRLALANHWTSGKHPLVARVFVNRVWALHFGRGIVGTPGDFGLNGDRPTHVELLDWLALDFVRHGWKIKRLHRQMMLSDAYRQVSTRSAELAMKDPDNKLLGRMNLRRLEAEAVRDGVLAAAGGLSLQTTGPSVPVAEDHDGRVVLGKRNLNEGLFANVTAAGSDAYRRSVYVQSKRALPLAMLETFDLPVMNPNCDLRRATTGPAQALLFLNDEFVLKASRDLAERLWRDANADDQRIATLYRLLFAVEPTAKEKGRCKKFLDELAKRFAADKDPKWQATLQQQPDAAAKRATEALCQTLLASNRFLYVD
jgi:mono/diheme cytochrome c family protein